MTLQERIAAVVEYYKSIQRDDGRPFHPRVIVTVADKRRIGKRMHEDGATVEDCCLAIDGAHSNPWNLGDNPAGKKYLSINLIFREDKFGEYHQQGIEHEDVTKAAADLALADAEAKRQQAADEQAARQEPRESLVKAFRQNRNN